MSKKTKEMLTLQVSIKEFFKRQTITKTDPNNPNIASFTKKVLKSPKRLAKEDQVLANFIQDQDQSKYYNLETFEDLNMLKIFESPDKKQFVVMFFGCHFPNDKKQEEKAYFYLIENLVKIQEKPYIFMYFHSKAAKNAMLFLKSCFKKLPLKFIFNLEKLYLIHTGILAKSSFFMQSGYHAKLLKKKAKFLKDFNKLVKEPGFNMDILAYIPEEFFKKSDESLMISHMLPSKHQDFIGQPLELLIISDNGIPEVINLMVSYFDMNKKFMKTKGIFRCAAGDKDLKRLEKALQDLDHDYLFEIDNPHIVASMLKRVLNKSQDPLLLFENYEEMVGIGNLNMLKNPEENLEKIREFLNWKIPKFNLRIVSFLLAFLRRVVKKKEENSMDSFNIAMVFAPCFIRPKVYTAEDIKKTAFVISFLKTLIENYQHLFEEKYPDCSSSESEGEAENEATFNEFPEQKQGLKVENYNKLENIYLKTEEEEQMRKNTFQPKPVGNRRITEDMYSDFEGKRNNANKEKKNNLLLFKKNSSKKSNLKVSKKEENKEEEKAEIILTVPNRGGFKEDFFEMGNVD